MARLHALCAKTGNLDTLLSPGAFADAAERGEAGGFLQLPGGDQPAELHHRHVRADGEQSGSGVPLQNPVAMLSVL